MYLINIVIRTTIIMLVLLNNYILYYYLLVLQVNIHFYCKRCNIIVETLESFKTLYGLCN